MAHFCLWRRMVIPFYSNSKRLIIYDELTPLLFTMTSSENWFFDKHLHIFISRQNFYRGATYIFGRGDFNGFASLTTYEHAQTWKCVVRVSRFLAGSSACVRIANFNTIIQSYKIPLLSAVSMAANFFISITQIWFHFQHKRSDTKSHDQILSSGRFESTSCACDSHANRHSILSRGDTRQVLRLNKL